MPQQDVTHPPTSALQEILDFTSELLGNNHPRALVIVGAARLEEDVKEILVTTTDKKCAKGGHGARVDLLTALGIIDQVAADAMKMIARIRNHFAHTSAKVSIHDAEIANDITQLFQKLDSLLDLQSITDKLFDGFIKKLKGQTPQSTWADNLLRKYQTAVISLLWYLAIVRYNLKPKPTAIRFEKTIYN